MDDEELSRQIGRGGWADPAAPVSVREIVAVVGRRRRRRRVTAAAGAGLGAVAVLAGLSLWPGGVPGAEPTPPPASQPSVGYVRQEVCAERNLRITHESAGTPGDPRPPDPVTEVFTLRNTGADSCAVATPEVTLFTERGTLTLTEGGSWDLRTTVRAGDALTVAVRELAKNCDRSDPSQLVTRVRLDSPDGWRRTYQDVSISEACSPGLIAPR